MNSLISVLYPRVGDVLAVSATWLGYHFQHVGIFIGYHPSTSERLVLSASREKGGVVIETWDEFAGGKPVTNRGPLGTFPPEVVLQRAYQLLGQPYDLANLNCDHVVRYAHGVKVESPQLREAVGVFTTLGLVFFGLYKLSKA